MAIRFGPAGIGPVKEAVSNLEMYHKLGLKACEIAFTYGIYIKQKEDAIKIGKKAEELGIRLSIHAPYWINLNSSDKKKIEESKKRILDCCKIGTLMHVHRVVFHPGYYCGMDKKEAYENIKNRILEMQEEIKQEKYTPKLAPETSGKINVFGSVEEISRLVKDTGCSFCLDFAHILARYKSYRFEETLSEFKDSKELHIHFSGIDYGEKGEKNHKKTPVKELKKLIKSLPKDKEITIINESPYPVEDSVMGLSISRFTENALFSAIKKMDKKHKMNKNILVSILLVASVFILATAMISAADFTVNAVTIKGIDAADTTVNAGDTISIKVEVTSDVDAKHVVITAELGDAKDETDEFVLKAGKPLKKELTLKVPF